MSIGFAYGVLCEPLEKQANDQGYTLGNKAEMFDKIRESINMCGFHVATNSQVDAMFKKLHNKIAKELKPLEK
jgi:hypothetical protein